MSVDAKTCSLFFQTHLIPADDAFQYHPCCQGTSGKGPEGLLHSLPNFFWLQIFLVKAQATWESI